MCCCLLKGLYQVEVSHLFLYNVFLSENCMCNGVEYINGNVISLSLNLSRQKKNIYLLQIVKKSQSLMYTNPSFDRHIFVMRERIEYHVRNSVSHLTPVGLSTV